MTERTSFVKYKLSLKAEFLALCLCTVVWIIMALWSLSVLTMSSGKTGWPPSNRVSPVSMVIRTPVRPIPALKEWFKSKQCAYSRGWYSACWQCFIRECVWVCVCVCYLQCIISGSSPLLLSLIELMNSRKSEGSSGTPWSGHATYCRCVTARSSPS